MTLQVEIQYVWMSNVTVYERAGKCISFPITTVEAVNP